MPGFVPRVVTVNGANEQSYVTFLSCQEKPICSEPVIKETFRIVLRTRILQVVLGHVNMTMKETDNFDRSIFSRSKGPANCQILWFQKKILIDFFN